MPAEAAEETIQLSRFNVNFYVTATYLFIATHFRIDDLNIITKQQKL